MGSKTLVAVRSVVPSLWLVTVPVASMVATFSSLLAQVMASSAVPVVVMVAVRVRGSPRTTVRSPPSMVRLVTALASVMVRVMVSLLLGSLVLVAVIWVGPSVAAVTIPVASMAATVSSLVVQVTRLLAPARLVTVAVRVRGSPRARVRSPPSMVTVVT